MTLKILRWRSLLFGPAQLCQNMKGHMKCTTKESSAAIIIIPVCILNTEGINDCNDCKPNPVYGDTDKDGWNCLCDNCLTL